MGELEDLRKENEKLRMSLDVIRGQAEMWTEDESDDLKFAGRFLLGWLDELATGGPWPTVEARDQRSEAEGQEDG